MIWTTCCFPMPTVAGDCKRVSVLGTLSSGIWERGYRMCQLHLVGVMSLVPALRGGNSEGIKRRYSLFSSHVCWRETTLAPLPTLCLSCTSTSLTTHHSQQGNNGHPWILHHSFSSEDITIQTVSDNCIQRSGRGLWGSKHIPTSCSLFTIYYDKNEKKTIVPTFNSKFWLDDPCLSHCVIAKIVLIGQ